MCLRKKYVYGIFALPLLTINHCFAIDIGFSLGDGKDTWTQDYRYSGDRKLEYAASILDSSPILKKFAYRLAVKLVNNNADGAVGNNTLDMSGISSSLGFYYSVTPEPVRLWIGSQIQNSYYPDVSLAGKGISGDVLGAGIGPAVGLNINIPLKLTLEGINATPSCTKVR